jgi:hypothetical protein
MTTLNDFETLAEFIKGYLHQDMDLIADSVPGAVAAFARDAGPDARERLKVEMDEFLKRFHNNSEEEFASRFAADFTPDENHQTVGEFFAMVEAILDDPQRAAEFEVID